MALARLWLLWALCAAVLGLTSASSDSGVDSASRSVHSFLLQKGDVSVQRFTTPINNASCSFSYSVSKLSSHERLQQLARRQRAAETTTTPSPHKPVRMQVLISEVVARYHGDCVSMRVDYWEYELCFNGRSRQYHGPDNYILSTAARADEKQRILYLEQGALCDVNQHMRSIRVSFGCRVGVPRPVLVSIIEPTVCQYDAVIAADDFCADANFPKLPADSVAQNNAGQGNEVSHRDGSEAWVLEMHPLRGGGSLCQVYPAEISQLTFEKFKLQIDSPKPLSGEEQRGGAEESIRLLSNSYVARRSIHEAVDSSVLEFVHLQQHRRSILALKDYAEEQFDGRLAFLKVYA